MIIDRGDFWHFKAQTAALDLEMAQLRLALFTATQKRNDLMTAFAVKHGLDPFQPLTLDDTEYSVTQS